MATTNETTIKPITQSSGKQSTGDLTGNPGYSISGGKWNPETQKIEGGGDIAWVGKGDAPENLQEAGKQYFNQASGGLAYKNLFKDMNTPSLTALAQSEKQYAPAATTGQQAAASAAPASQSSQLSLGGAPTQSNAQQAAQPTTQSQQLAHPFQSLTGSEQQILQQLAAAGLNEAQVRAMDAVNKGDPSAFQALDGPSKDLIMGFIRDNMSGQDAQNWWAAATTSTGPNGGNATSPGGNTGVGNQNANLNFTDQGDGVYRGWKSEGPGTAVNTINPNGSVQGQFQDTRGNEFRGEAVTANSMGDMDVERAQAAFAAENGREMTQDELSSYRLQQIMKSDSPLMQLARQDAIDLANARGLGNSSLAAGAAQAEMVRQASPLAQQEASAYGQMESQNQMLESDRLENNAGREQQVNLSNQAAENAATSQEFGTEADLRKFNANTETSTNMQNAAMANDMLNADRQRTFQYNLAQLTGDQDYAKQQLASQAGVDIANIEGQYKQLISENDTAARMFDSTYKAIADVLSNKDIFADEASEKANYLVGMMQNMMDALLAFENLDLGDAGSEGSGKQSDFVA